MIGSGWGSSSRFAVWGRLQWSQSAKEDIKENRDGEGCVEDTALKCNNSEQRKELQPKKKGNVWCC